MLLEWDQYIATAHEACDMFKNSPEFLQEEWKAGVFKNKHPWKPAAIVRVPQFDPDGKSATVRYIKHLEAKQIEAWWNGQLCYFFFLHMADAIQFDLTFRDDPEYQGAQ